MIVFTLDSTSGVAIYLQLVQQVRRAFRLGLLQAGDQLPSIREVVAALAVNPNTVLRAYQELERDGLVRSRQGLGTFVARTLAADTLPHHAALRRELTRWLRRARQAGMDREDMIALWADTLEEFDREEGIA